jgi:hypothetical protein
MEELKKTQIERSLRKFRDYSSDLCSADHNTLPDRFSKFFHFCSTDQVFSNIHNELRQIAANGFTEWLEERLSTGGSFVGSGKLVFPVDEDLRISYMYELLYRMEIGEVKFFNFVHHFFAIGSNRYDDHVYAFNDAVSTPLFRDIEYKLEEMLEEIEEQDGPYVPISSIQIIHHANNVIQQNASGSDINQTANISVNDELKALFDQLRDMAESNSEDVDIVEMAEAEAQKEKPKTGAIKILLNGLSFASSAAGIISAILTAMGG